ncbi:MAG: hypothetical protein R6U65_13290, partial [Perlabentimonas sp.]
TEQNATCQPSLECFKAVKGLGLILLEASLIWSEGIGTSGIAGKKYLWIFRFEQCHRFRSISASDSGSNSATKNGSNDATGSVLMMPKKRF